MIGFRRWWWVPLLALTAIFLKALLLTPWVAGQAEDGAMVALREAGLDRVTFVEVDGVDRFGADGLNVVLEGPAADEAVAVAAVEARPEIHRVSYRVTDGDQTGTDQTDGGETGQGRGQEAGSSFTPATGRGPDHDLPVRRSPYPNHRTSKGRLT